jgi:hypothetical protein
VFSRTLNVRPSIKFLAQKTRLWRVRVAPLIACGFWITYTDLVDHT